MAGKSILGFLLIHHVLRFSMPEPIDFVPSTIRKIAEARLGPTIFFPYSFLRWFEDTQNFGNKLYEPGPFKSIYITTGFYETNNENTLPGELTRSPQEIILEDTLSHPKDLLLSSVSSFCCCCFVF